MMGAAIMLRLYRIMGLLLGTFAVVLLSISAYANLNRDVKWRTFLGNHYFATIGNSSGLQFHAIELKPYVGKPSDEAILESRRDLLPWLASLDTRDYSTSAWTLFDFAGTRYVHINASSSSVNARLVGFPYWALFLPLMTGLVLSFRLAARAKKSQVDLALSSPQSEVDASPHRMLSASTASIG